MPITLQSIPSFAADARLSGRTGPVPPPCGAALRSVAPGGANQHNASCRPPRHDVTVEATGAQEVRTLAGPETPKLMVDVVIPSESGVVLIRRGSDPFEGQWALPGGFVDVGETVHEAAVREAAEETGLAVEVSRLVGVYSEPDRDPRGHNVSVAFLVRVLGGQMQAASDAAEVEVLDPNTVELAFDHSRIIADAMV